MNVRIFWVRAMKCMCAQTRPRFILSSERVLGGMEFEPMLTPREKSPLPENVPRGGLNPRRCGQRAQALPTELFRSHILGWCCHSFCITLTCLHSYSMRTDSVCCRDCLHRIDWLDRSRLFQKTTESSKCFSAHLKTCAVAVDLESNRRYLI